MILTFKKNNNIAVSERHILYVVKHLCQISSILIYYRQKKEYICVVSTQIHQYLNLSNYEKNTIHTNFGCADMLM